MIPGTELRAQWNVLPNGEEGEYLTDRLTEEAVSFITQNKDKPFFLYFPHYGVHTPLQAKPEVVAKYAAIPESKRQGLPEYAAMVESIDDSLGRIVATLEQLQLTDNTVIIFTSDNGGFWKATDHAPLRANKGAYYEGGIRVPLIIQWPGVAQPGLVIDQPVISNDLYPTCLTAAGLPLLPNQHLDGLDLSQLVQGTSARLERDSIFWHFRTTTNIPPASRPVSFARRMETDRNFDPAGLELYNLEDDLSESKNLALSQPKNWRNCGWNWKRGEPKWVPK